MHVFIYGFVQDKCKKRAKKIEAQKTLRREAAEYLSEHVVKKMVALQEEKTTDIYQL